MLIILCTVWHQYSKKRICIFQLPGHNLSNDISTQLVFKNNSADIAGSVLYGGEIDDCKLTGLDSYNSGEVFDMIVHIEDDNTNSTISSDPFRVCLCQNNLPNCGKSHLPYTVYPGEIFQVSVIAHGQRNGTIAEAVRSYLDIQFPAFQQNIPVEGDKLQGYQYLQKAHNTCTTLNYTIFSLSQISMSLDLHTDGPCSTFGNAEVQGRRKMFLIRGAGLLNVLCEAQMCGQSPNWLGGRGACPPENFRKTDALRSILMQSEPICSTLY